MTEQSERRGYRRVWLAGACVIVFISCVWGIAVLTRSQIGQAQESAASAAGFRYIAHYARGDR